MRPEDLSTCLRGTPFVPLGIRHNSGKTLAIRHPETLRVGRSGINVYSFASKFFDP